MGSDFQVAKFNFCVGYGVRKAVGVALVLLFVRVGSTIVDPTQVVYAIIARECG